MIQTMNGAGTVPDEADDEYVQFFRALGIFEQQKASYLARLLEAFYELGAKLDEHLAPTGAVLHAAVSRMCQAENPMDAPNHRWIRIHDRVGFFSDQDDHGSRIVNIGLAYAYRHKELEALSAANTVRLEQLRRAAAGDALLPGDTLLPATLADGEQDVPFGGVVVRNDGASVQGGRGGAEASSNPRGWSKPVGAPGPSSGADAGGDGEGGSGFLPPTGGLVVRRDAPSFNVPAGTGDDVPENGGLVVARRKPGGCQAADPYVPATPLDVDGGASPTTHCIEQPLITPTPEAVTCVSTVLEAFLKRADAKDVMRQLLIDGLLSWGRLHSGQTTKAAAGVISADEVNAEWPASRQLLYKLWPVWKAPDDRTVALPPQGTVSRHTHAGRAMLSSRWKVKVDMTEINPVISRLDVKSHRYFKKGSLDTVLEVVRIAPGLKVPLGVTIASTLMVASWDSDFCSVLKQLAASGRAPVRGKAPLTAAACHNFETAGIGEGLVVAVEAGHPVGVPSVGVAASPPAAPALAAVMAARQAEVDDLLAADKSKTAGEHRARRVEARRRERQTAAATPTTAAPAAVSSARKATKRPAPASHKATGATAKRTKGGSGNVVGPSQAPPPASSTTVIPRPGQPAVVFGGSASVLSEEVVTSPVAAPPTTADVHLGSFASPSSMTSPSSALALDVSRLTAPSVPGCGGDGQPSPSGHQLTSPPHLQRCNDLERVAASVHGASHRADGPSAVLSPSVEPSAAAAASAASSVPFHASLSDEDADVPAVDEDEKDSSSDVDVQ